MDMFGLINMNGRMYDPIIGRMLSPDPYVPNGAYTQDFNRYMYARNNPLAYIDPDGEWVHLAIGALIGGTVNVIVNWKKIDGDWGKGLAYFGIGAAAGALGAGVGAGASAMMGSALSSATGTVAAGSFSAGFLGTSTVISTGFAAGFVSGVAGGATSGFLNSAGNNWLENGKDATFKGVFGAGLDGMWKGAVIGGAVGGVVGGIDAHLKGLDFWTGADKQAVQIKVELDGKITMKSGKDFDGMSARSQARMQTQTEGNAAFSTNAKGETVLTLPRGVKPTNLALVGNDAFVDGARIVGNQIIYTPITRVDQILISGYRYTNYPIRSVFDLFSWRPWGW
ncbi:MAG: hypothetical protein FWE63_08290, partial [Bacteroidales bacterium]|nr:hypothetical protein [Bacteroidales bacterium]